MTPASAEFLQKARFLRNAAPQQFQAFLAASAEYASERTEELLYATDNLPIVQGRAQQCAAILKLLKEADNG